MDPNATLANARKALLDGNLNEAAFAYEALDNWLVKGGFLPDAWSKA